MQPVSASDIPSKAGGEILRPLSKDEIYRIVKKYGEAAKHAQIAGFDTVEIHGEDILTWQKLLKNVLESHV